MTAGALAADAGRRGRAWRGLVSLAWRESRNARRRLLLFMSAISVGVAALVAIDSYTGNVTRSVQEQSRALLGGDLAISARRAFPRGVELLLDSLARAGTAVARTTSFGSMATVPRTEGARLVQVRAVSPNFPFYGELETEPADARRALHDGHNALVDQSLLIALGAHVGDSVSLGQARFAIVGTLLTVPGDAGISAAFGPRVYIPLRFVPETQLLGFGSRSEHEALLRVRPGTDARAVARGIRPVTQAAQVRVRTYEDTEQGLTEAIEGLGRFLGIVALVALLLGGVGVASAIRAYVAEKRDTAAILRCLGATGRQVLAIYVLEAAGLGLVGAAAGALLGVAAQFALPHVLGGFIPVDVSVRLEPRALLAGLGVGVWIAVLFALRPLLALRHVSPLEAIRQGSSAAPARWRDVPQLVATAALAGSVAAVAVIRGGELRQGLGMAGGLAVALGVLTVSGGIL